MIKRQIERPLLLPFSLIFRTIVSLRNLLFDTEVLSSERFGLPVISVGNITVGGTGKTPHVEFLTKLLHKDFRVAVMSRGYKRKSRGFVLATRKSSLADIGDESLQIKQKFPDIQVAVDNNRIHGIQQLLNSAFPPQVIVLDDAFQHRYVRPGLSILLVDYTRPVFNDVMLPAGNLREPWQNSKRADIIIVTKCPFHLSPADKELLISRLRLRKKQDVFFTAYAYGQPAFVFPPKDGKSHVSYKQLKKSNAGIFLVTGIANPQPLLRFLNHLLPVSESLFFPDHHPFSLKDLNTIQSKFNAMSSEKRYVVVTEKDAVKLRELTEMNKSLRKSLLYIPIEVEFLGDRKLFEKRVLKYIKKARA